MPDAITAVNARVVLTGPRAPEWDIRVYVADPGPGAVICDDATDGHHA